MVCYPSILACKISWTEEPATVHGVTKEVGTTYQLYNNNSSLKTEPIEGAPICFHWEDFQQLPGTSHHCADLRGLPSWGCSGTIPKVYLTSTPRAIQPSTHSQSKHCTRYTGEWASVPAPKVLTCLLEYSRGAAELSYLMADIMGIYPISFNWLNKYLLRSYCLPRTVLGAGLQDLKELTAEWETDK